MPVVRPNPDKTLASVPVTVVSSQRFGCAEIRDSVPRLHSHFLPKAER